MLVLLYDKDKGAYCKRSVIVNYATRFDPDLHFWPLQASQEYTPSPSLLAKAKVEEGPWSKFGDGILM